MGGDHRRRCRPRAAGARGEREPRDALRARRRRGLVAGSETRAPPASAKVSSRSLPSLAVASLPPRRATVGGQAAPRPGSRARCLATAITRRSRVADRPRTTPSAARSAGACLEPGRALRRAHLLFGGPGRPLRLARRALTHLPPLPPSPNRSGQRRRAARGARLRSATRDSVQGARPAPPWCRRSVSVPSFVRTLPTNTAPRPLLTIHPTLHLSFPPPPAHPRRSFAGNAMCLGGRRPFYVLFEWTDGPSQPALGTEVPAAESSCPSSAGCA